MDLIEQIRRLNRVAMFAESMINSKVSINKIYLQDMAISLIYNKPVVDNNIIIYSIIIAVNFIEDDNVGITCMKFIDENKVETNHIINTTDRNAPKRTMELLEKYEFLPDTTNEDDDWDDYIVL